MTIWEQVARMAHMNFGVYIDWEERFYLCPECGEPIYEVDWSDEELLDHFCPICQEV